LREEGVEELHLSLQRGHRLVEPRAKFGDFRHALGRAGVDPRMPVEEQDSLQEVLLTNWSPRFRPPPVRAHSRDRGSAMDVSMDLGAASMEFTTAGDAEEGGAGFIDAGT